MAKQIKYLAIAGGVVVMLLLGVIAILQSTTIDAPLGNPIVEPPVLGIVKQTSVANYNDAVASEAVYISHESYYTSGVSYAKSNGATAASPSGIISPRTYPPSNIDTMIFQNYGTNVFINTADDSQSTFGLDVDTASYTVAKNYIMRGLLPPTDAIRMEEFVNYFDYNYPNPNEDFGIYLEGSNSPFDEGIHYLSIGIKSRDIEERDNAMLTFVVDVSGSMDRENRIGLVKRSLRYLINQLREGDEIAIVSYNSNANLLLEHTSIQEKARILSVIDSLTPGGSTNAEAGLKLGYSQADLGFKQGANNRVILLSDGVANVGITDPDGILNQLKDYKEKGITITTVGVGLGNYNDVLLEQIADKGDGNYAYINDFNEARRVFSQQLTQNLQLAAKDAKIQVSFDPMAVERYRLIGYENRALEDEDFRNDSKDAGELGAGHEVTALYEIVLKDKNRDLGAISLRYKDPKTDVVRESSRVISVDTLSNSFSTRSDEFKLAVAVSRFAGILKLSNDPTTISDVTDIVNTIEPTDDTVDDFRVVLSNARRLIEIRGQNE